MVFHSPRTMKNSHGLNLRTGALVILYVDLIVDILSLIKLVIDPGLLIIFILTSTSTVNLNIPTKKHTYMSLIFVCIFFSHFTSGDSDMSIRCS